MGKRIMKHRKEFVRIAVKLKAEKKDMENQQKLLVPKAKLRIKVSPWSHG